MAFLHSGMQDTVNEAAYSHELATSTYVSPTQKSLNQKRMPGRLYKFEKGYMNSDRLYHHADQPMLPHDYLLIALESLALPPKTSYLFRAGK